MKLLDNYSDSIKRLCATHKVKKLYAFGSVLREDFNESSDIDFLVYFDNIDLINYTNNYFNFKFSLEDLFKRPVGLIEEKALKNPYFVLSISNTIKLVHGI